MRLVGVCQDVTTRRTAEAQQNLLMHELSHRVKNSLATVQSIARMTFRSSSAPRIVCRVRPARQMQRSGWLRNRMGGPNGSHIPTRPL